MLNQVAPGVLVHEADFMQSNTAVVQGDAGVLLADPGIRVDEIADIFEAVTGLGQTVAVGFSTHPHWDHLLWLPTLGNAPRYITAAGAAVVQARLSGPDWRTVVTPMIPEDLIMDVPLDESFAKVAGLPAEATVVPWEGPQVRIIQHSAHAPGHAALLIADRGVLVAGDMLSDILIPILNAMSPTPIDDYLAGLQLLEDASEGVDVVIPGHGSVGDAVELRRRIAEDRAYLAALRDGVEPDDSRLGASAKPGWEWVGSIHERQAQQLAK